MGSVPEIEHKPLDRTILEKPSSSACWREARILELIEILDELRASPDYEVYQFAEKDAAVLDRIAAAQREELEREIGELKAEAERRAAEVEELAGRVPF